MISANELRIGNWVKLNNPKARPKEVGNFAEVLAIDSEHSFNEHKGTVTIKPFGELNSYRQFFVFIEPIELTPEILEKSGYYNYDEENNRWLHTEDVGFGDYYMNEKLLYFGTSCVSIEYLHELQNLIYALNKKELNVEL